MIKFIKIKIKEIDLLDLPSGTYIEIERSYIIMTRDHYKEFKTLLAEDDNILEISHLENS